MTPREERIISLLPVCKGVASRYVRTHPIRSGTPYDYEDLVSWAMLGAIDAVDRWDETKGASLISYGWRRAYGSMIDELRKVHGRHAPRGVEVPMDPHEAAFDILSVDEQGYSQVLADDLLANLPALLYPESQRNITIMLGYVGGALMRELGVQHGISESAVCVILQRMRARLRERLVA